MTGRSRRPLVGLLTAETISRSGSRMSMVALPWFVLVLTGSPARTGLVAAAEMLPFVLACALGGPLLDRIGVRRASVLADTGSTLAVAAVPLLYRSGTLPFAALLGLVALVGLLRGLGDTAKQAVFPRTVAGSGVDLTRATSLHDGLSRLAGLLGAPLAGLLITVLDAPTVLLLDAGTFAAGALLVAVCVPPDRPRMSETSDPGAAGGHPPAGGHATAGGEPGVSGGAPAAGRDPVDGESGERESYLAALRSAWRFARTDRLIIAIGAMLTATNLFDQAYSAVLAPVWARDVAGDATALGLLFGAFGVGAVTGNAVFTMVAPRASRWAVLSIGFLIGGGPRFVATALLGEHRWALYVVSFVAGVAVAAINPILGAVLYERVPERLQARVLGMSQALSWSGIPIGGLAGGALVQWLGLNPSLYVFGGLYLAATLLPFVDRAWRGLDDRPVPGNGAGAVAGAQVREPAEAAG